MSKIEIKDNASFKEWRKWSGYSLEACRLKFDVSKRTIQNWESGNVEAPRAVIICLQLFSGRLDFIGKCWQGFRICSDGCLESSKGNHIFHNEIDGLNYLYKAAGLERSKIVNATGFKRLMPDSKNVLTLVPVSKSSASFANINTSKQRLTHE